MVRAHRRQAPQIKSSHTYLLLVVASDGIGSAGSGALSMTVLDTIAPLAAATAAGDHVVRVQ
jgi:hypothetical protein